jgi:Na+/glutamate symporter
MVAISSSDNQNVVAFLLLGILLGATTNYLLSYFTNHALPYTPIVFLEGVIIAELHKSLKVDNDTGLYKSIDEWVNIDAELILYIFLPALLFRSY